jgi:hypothetical protein
MPTGGVPGDSQFTCRGCDKTVNAMKGIRWALTRQVEERKYTGICPECAAKLVSPPPPKKRGQKRSKAKGKSGQPRPRGPAGVVARRKTR